MQRTKTIAFELVIAGASKGVSGLSREAETLITKNLDGKDGDVGFFSAFRSWCITHFPRRESGRYHKVALENLQKLADKLAAGYTRIKLLEWLRYKLKFATTDAVYQSGNPFDDCKVEDLF